LIKDFNDYMGDVIDNEAIRDTLGLLNARIASVRATALEAPGRIEVARGQLDDIFNAIVARNPRLAAKAMEVFVRSARDAALSVATSQVQSSGAAENWIATFSKIATE